MAEQCKRVSADLYDWSAMTWKAHWPMRLGATLARARAALITEGVRCRQQVAGDGQRDPEAEEKRVSMQYRAYQYRSRRGRDGGGSGQAAVAW